MTEEEIESEMTRNYEMGIGMGMERAGSLLMQEALEYFTAGKDTEARMLRKLAQNFKETGVDLSEKAREKALKY